jgi:hypothetical protein
MKHWCTIFYTQVGLVRIPQKRAGMRYTKLVFLHPVGYAGHVVHSGAVRSGREMSTHYFSCSGGTDRDSTKSALGHVTPNLRFYIWWDLRVT